MTTLRAPFAPCRVELDGAPLDLSSWNYDPSSGVLRASFSATDARLTAFEAC